MKRAASTLGYLAGILTITIFTLSAIAVWTGDTRYGWLAGLSALAAAVVGATAVVLASQADERRKQQDGRPW
ncbi:hypothetical protein ACLBWP_03430 [Microbacterium sp. M1A1_1b]